MPCNCKIKGTEKLTDGDRIFCWGKWVPVSGVTHCGLYVTFKLEGSDDKVAVPYSVPLCIQRDSECLN